MRIASSTAGSGVPSSRKAQIEAQIKKLEARKQKLLKQLTGGGGGGSAPAAGSPKGTVAAGSAQPAAQPTQSRLPTSQPQNGEGQAPSLPQASAPSVESPSALDMSSLSASSGLQGGGSGGGGSGGGGGGVPDVSGIMKQIMQIEMQIMNLRSQIGDDGLDSLMQASAEGGNIDPAAMASASAARQQAAAGESAAAPSSDKYPPVTVKDGHVDGYV
ncbi:MAG: hypothetical protein LUE17_03235 [Planctomycetaceae bacterium]|nr:hypothetical protein [Planctomycetaceae bacterium]